MCNYCPRQEFWRRETRTARKEYRCVECGVPITKGISYKYVMAKEYEGNLWQVHVCSQCDKDWDTLCAIEDRADPQEMRCLCIHYGNLKERIRDAFKEGLIHRNYRIAKRWIPEALMKHGQLAQVPT